MKFGVLVNNNNVNLGDDIQSYAAAQFLPKIDYFVDRETIDTFQSDNNEAVACIFSAWWMRKKWNFPPASCLYPKLISMHLTNFEIPKKAAPFYTRMWEGVGGDYMRTFAPVGARDKRTFNILKKLDIPAYFSGCVTLTLPKQPIIKKEKEYICLVDLEPAVEKRVVEMLSNTNVELKIMTQNRKKQRRGKEDCSWECRTRETEELLTIYQNAKCVITRRLHVALPCLAMEVPVFVVFFKTNIRFSGYLEMLHMATPEEFLQGDYEYDFLNPPQNKPDYLHYRNQLTTQLKAFVAEAEMLDNVPKQLPYTEEEKKEWQFEVMKDTLNQYQPAANKMVVELEQLRVKTK